MPHRFASCKQRLVDEVATGGHLGHSDRELVKFKILDDKRKTASKNSSLDRRRVDFRLLRELVSKIPWETAFEGIQGQECWSFFKYYLLRAWEQAISKYQNSCRWSKRLA